MTAPGQCLGGRSPGPDLELPAGEKALEGPGTFVRPPFWKEAAPSGWRRAEAEEREGVEKWAAPRLPLASVASWAWLPVPVEPSVSARVARVARMLRRCGGRTPRTGELEASPCVGCWPHPRGGPGASACPQFPPLIPVPLAQLMPHLGDHKVQCQTRT